MMQIRVALRNVFRNRRRTALILTMIAGGFTAVILFDGFVYNTKKEMTRASINGQYGHLQVARSVFWEQTAENAEDNLLPDFDKLADEIRKMPHVTYVGGRLNFSALISAGERSTTALGISLDIDAEADKLGAYFILADEPLSDTIERAKKMGVRHEDLLPDGRTILSNERPFEVIVGHLLGAQLGVKKNDRLTILSHTFDGIINAIDVEVKGLFLTGLTEIDSSTIIIPLQTAQTLLDTTQVERLVVGLDNDNIPFAQRARRELEQRLQASDSSIQVKVWTDLAKLYREVIAYYDVQTLFIKIIIVSLVFLGILNTLGMAVFERLGEIGTIRSLGFRGSEVIRQFLLEGTILGVLGTVAGATLAIIVVYLLNSANIPLIIPGASHPVKLQVDLFAGAFISATAMTMVASIIASLIPAVRASRTPIVDALKHNV